mmetsp:Transcript_3631/g.6893  ORF Transcript_3631/g.6893 Transcript_3631/m.6893 type:complete len:424 (-) Transcript_3631:216-1487(-)
MEPPLNRARASTSPEVEKPEERRSTRSLSFVEGATMSVLGYRDKARSSNSASTDVKTLYWVLVKDKLGRSWSTEKTYTDFRELYKLAKYRVLSVDYDIDYAFPSKQWIQHGDDVKEKRRRSFHELLQHLSRKGDVGLLTMFLIDCEEARGARLSEDEMSELSESDQHPLPDPQKPENGHHFHQSEPSTWKLATSLTLTALLSSIISCTIATYTLRFHGPFRQHDDHGSDEILMALRDALLKGDELKDLVSALEANCHLRPEPSYLPLPTQVHIDETPPRSLYIFEVVLGLCLACWASSRLSWHRFSWKANFASLVLLYGLEQGLSSTMHSPLAIHMYNFVFRVGRVLFGALLFSSAFIRRQDSSAENCEEYPTSDDEASGDANRGLSLSDLKNIHDLIVEGLTRPSLTEGDLRTVHRRVTGRG